MKEARDSYHHGDLRGALLAAAEAELSDAGIEAFSLRKVARRAGVSHAAPAHHFGDTAGLLAALAAEGYRRFRATLIAHEAAAPAGDARARLVESGLGYLAFARANPALFRLMFASAKPRADDPELCAAGGAAYDHLVQTVEALGPDPSRLGPVAAWALVHGLAELLIAGRPESLQALSPDARDAALRDLLYRYFPS